MQLHLGGPPPRQPGQHLAVALVPLGQLLRGHRVGVLARVEAADERRRARGAAADVEGPADEGAVLIRVEDHVGGRVERDAVLEALAEMGGVPCQR